MMESIKIVMVKTIPVQDPTHLEEQQRVVVHKRVVQFVMILVPMVLVIFYMVQTMVFVTMVDPMTLQHC